MNTPPAHALADASHQGRPLSGVEQLAWAVSRCVPLNFVVMARLRGTVSTAALQAAAIAVRRGYLGLVSRVERHPNGRLSFTSNSVPDIPVIERHVDDETAWEREVESQLSLPFDSHVGPLARLVLLRRGEVCDLLVVCEHCVSDGLSAVNLLRDVLTHTAMPATEPLERPYPASMHELLLSEVVEQRRVQIVRRWGRRIAPWWLWGQQWWQRLRSRSAPSPAVFEDHPVLDEMQQQMRKRGIVVTSWSLSAELTQALQQHCRQESTTVHAALAVAWVRAHVEHTPQPSPRRLVVSTPLNARKRLQPAAQVGAGLYNLLVDVPIVTDLACDFWHAARAARRELERQTTDEKLFGGMLVLEDWVQQEPPQLVKQLASQVDLEHPPRHSIVSISNLGRVEMPARFDGFAIEAIYGPCVLGHGYLPVIGVATHNERMTFSLSGLQDKPLTAPAIQCVPGFVNWLERACRR